MAPDVRDLDSELEHTSTAHLLKDPSGRMHIGVREERYFEQDESHVVTACDGTLPGSNRIGVHDLHRLWEYSNGCPHCKGAIKHRRGVDPEQSDWDRNLEKPMNFGRYLG